jgi:hypothetical protein
MRNYVFLLFLALGACSQQTATIQNMQNQIDSLQTHIGQTYRPGFGDFMLGVQIHHNKLWYAGINQNWPLAQFEIDEIKEAIGDIKAYNADRPEVVSLPMIDPALDSISNSVKNKDLASFKSSFTLLTNTCNNCHHATKHEFNVIKIPDNPPFTNQEFKVQ